MTILLINFLGYSTFVNYYLILLLQIAVIINTYVRRRSSRQRFSLSLTCRNAWRTTRPTVDAQRYSEEIARVRLVDEKPECMNDHMKMLLERMDDGWEM